MKVFLLAACAAFVVSGTYAVSDDEKSCSSNPVLPGYLTDPTAMKGVMSADKSYQPPESLKYPYVATYYVKPTVTPKENVKVAFYVTDFDSSRIRFLDDSHTFTAFLEYRLRGGESKTVTLENLKSGDAAFDLGRLSAGDYEFRVWVEDQKGRESHRVIHDFRVASAEDLAIPADKIYRMTESDLATYGLRNDGDVEKVVAVAANGATTVLKSNRSGAPGYTVTVPLDEKTGKIPLGAVKKAKVIYDAGYDRTAAEATAVTNAVGIQKLLDEKAAAGFRKIVMLPGTYRISHTKKIYVPDGVTFDLGGAVLKQNGFAGASSLLVNLSSVRDAHLVNGTLEGDYWEHDYAGSPNNSEWPAGFQIGGDSWYSSVENVKVVDITGYGGQNGIARDANGDLSFFLEGLPRFAPGGLNPATGEVDLRDACRFTTDFKNLAKIRAKGRTRLQISKYLGYQGRATRSWQMTVAWYDADKKFISAETAWQYREMWIPENAAFLRVSVEDESLESVKKCELVLTAMRLPVNCAVKNCTFDRCRCVGYAASAMKNMLFEGNFFTRSGESAACCAFDAEDGWDQMQDAYFLKNVFRDNPRNNSILTCAGHNFILEENDGDVYFWGRTHSPCVRRNKIGHGTYHCDSRLRSGYGRFDGNTYEKGVVLGENSGENRDDNWDYVLSGLVFDGGKDAFPIEVGHAGRVVNCTFRKVAVRIANAYACTFDHCTDASTYKPFPGGRWFECTVKDSTFSRLSQSNVWERCHYVNTKFDKCQRGDFALKDCDFTGCEFRGLGSAYLRMTGCKLTDTSVEGGYWEKPARCLFRDCTIKTRDDTALLKLGVYTIGRIGIDGCTVTGNGPLIDVFDLRPISLPPNAAENPDLTSGAIAVRNTTYRGTAKALIVHEKPGRVSSKKISVLDKGKNNLAPGVDFVEYPPSTWSRK